MTSFRHENPDRMYYVFFMLAVFGIIIKVRCLHDPIKLLCFHGLLTIKQMFTYLSRYFDVTENKIYYDNNNKCKNLMQVHQNKTLLKEVDL